MAYQPNLRKTMATILTPDSTAADNQGVKMRESYISQRVASLKPSGIRRFFDIAATMKEVISLGIGEPDFDTPKPVIDAGVRALQNGATHYTSNAGILGLRKALSANLERLYGVTYDPVEEMIISVGGSEALYLAATALLDPGDEVIIPTPCFVSYQAEVYMAGGCPVEVPCYMEDNFNIDPARIEAAVTPRTKAILLGFPNNPTGAVATRERLLEIARIAEKYDLIVMSDEIYDRLVYRLCLRTGAFVEGYVAHSPVHGHVGADGSPGSRHCGARGPG